jgi:hypothetical protein
MHFRLVVFLRVFLSTTFHLTLYNMSNKSFRFRAQVYSGFSGFDFFYSLKLLVLLRFLLYINLCLASPVND